MKSDGLSAWGMRACCRHAAYKNPRVA
jgi:hypothetical protein